MIKSNIRGVERGTAAYLRLNFCPVQKRSAADPDLHISHSIFYAMNLPDFHQTDDVENLLRNAQLRDALEPLYDESIGCVNANVMSTSSENEFLQSMLEWERAPIMPICEWFDPPLELPSPDKLDDEHLHNILQSTIQELFTKNIVLDFTEHLSDRQLYYLIYRDILPSFEKRIDRRTNYLHWDCANVGDDPEIWLRYYATEEERQAWVDETGGYPPQVDDPPYPRRVPRAPL
ncbi:hypothetical protein [Bythopirellula polymerisocia]|uniref:hypothetical protein n=1 Tax=Bythopirellula polymerisocia TaxID=2528003 RepID=UPI001E604486|nr:hypothetical protein [Bythopirellula polymerisocia]